MQSAQLIIPIKRKHALGIELHPYSYQKVDLLDSLNSELIIFGDSVSIAKEYKQAGGIMAFNLSAAKVPLPPVQQIVNRSLPVSRLKIHFLDTSQVAFQIKADIS